VAGDRVRCFFALPVQRSALSQLLALHDEARPYASTLNPSGSVYSVLASEPLRS